MQQYLSLCREALECGMMKENRTDNRALGYQGDMRKYDLSLGFPAVTTKELKFPTVVAEMLGFLRGYNSAAQFREIGCNVWNANANENKQWLANPNRRGSDDLGRIYGVQARDWQHIELNMEAQDMLLGKGGSNPSAKIKIRQHDQLLIVLEDLCKGVDNRREIVIHWNPGELQKMALPPCHLLYQFGIQGDTLNMCMYQRSCDLPLGIPFNIAGYAWLLSVIARIAKLKVGVFTHFMWDIHIYENQIELMKEVQLERSPYPLPKLWINPKIKTLKDLETWVTPDDFVLEEYQHHPHIAYPFSV